MSKMRAVSKPRSVRTEPELTSEEREFLADLNTTHPAGAVEGPAESWPEWTDDFVWTTTPEGHRLSLKASGLWDGDDFGYRPESKPMAGRPTVVASSRAGNSA